MPIRKKSISPGLRSKRKRDTSSPIELEAVFLELKSTVIPTWNSPEPHAYITPLHGSVRIPSGDAGECIAVGSISAHSVRLGNAAEDGVSWFDVLDLHSADTALYLDLFEIDRFSYTDWVESTLEPYSSDFLILDRIRIEPQFRGRGYGLYAAQLMIQSFGPPGGLVVCVPAPYELLAKYELSSIKEALNVTRDEGLPAWGLAETKLREFWSLLGFRQVSNSNSVCSFSFSSAITDAGYHAKVLRTEKRSDLTDSIEFFPDFSPEPFTRPSVSLAGSSRLLAPFRSTRPSKG